MSPFLRSRTARTLAAVVMVAAVLGLTAGPANSWSSTDDTYSVVLDGSDYSNLHDVTAAPDGGSYACGHFRGTVDMDPDPTNTVSVTAASTQPALIVKLDADGNYEWHSTVASTNSSIWGCEVDSAGNVFAVGVFRSSATVGSVTVWTDMGNNNDVAFVAKFASDGTGEWIRAPKRKGGNPGDGARSFAYDIDIDAADNVYVTGRFKKTVDLNLNPGIENYHQAPGSTWYNTFLIKLNNAGNTQWSRSWGGTENTYGEAVVVDGSGNVIVGGWSNPIQMDIDPDPNDVVLVGTPGNDDSNKRNAMLSKFDSSGDLVWGHTFGSNSTDYIYGLAVDASNNIYATGQTGRKIGANASGGNWQTNPSLSAIQVNSFAGGDPYIAKFAPSGDTVWMSVFGGTGGADKGLGIAVSGSAIYSVGEFNQISDFTGGGSTTTDPGRVYHGGNKFNPYLVRHNTSDGSFSCAAALIGNADAEGRGLDLDVNGKPLMSGYFHGSLDFDPTGATNSVASSGQSDGFVARFTTDCAIDAAAPPPSFTTAITAGNTCSTGCATIGLAEGGNTGTISVVLGTAPAGNVVFDVTASDTTEATVSTATLTFTNSNWDTPQVITVSSVDDDLDDARQNWTVTVAVNDAASHDAWDSLGDQVTNGKTTDDDTAGFTLSGTTASVSETGTTDTFTVVLDSEPTGNVVFGISSADTGETTVSAAALTFTTSNWDTPQTITVTGIDDTATDGNQTTTVTVTVNDSSTADSAYDALSDRTVAATTADDDSPGFTVAASGGSTTVSEAGSTDTFTVVLNAQPTSDVVFDVSSGDTGEATVSVASLTFTTSNWDTAQTVTVTGVDDTINDGDQSTAITVTVNDGSSDNAFDSLADQTLSATTTDDDSPGMTLSKTSTSVSETGTTDTFTVVLNVAPSSDVVVNVTRSDSGEASVSPSTLTFTTSNWDTAQTVTVTGIDDPDDDGSQASTVTLSVDDASSDDDYDVVSDSSVSVLTDDDDDPVVTTTTPPPPPPPTTLPPLGTVSLSATPSCTSMTLTWAPGTTSGLQSFTLAWKSPNGGWITHSTHLPSARSAVMDNLAIGQHSFQILATYVDGTSKASNVGAGAAVGCPVFLPPTPTTTVPPPTTTVPPPTPTTTATTTTTTTTTTVAPTPTTAAPTPTTATPTTAAPTPTTATPTTAAPTTAAPAPTTAAPIEGQTEVALSEGDPDGDGLSNDDEAALGTDPGNADTDGDGISDGREVANLTDPLDPNDPGDPDDDGNVLTSPGVLATAAGLVAAAGLGLSGFGSRIGASLVRFLSGTGFGLFLIGLFRRDKRPGPPIDLVISFDGPLAHLAWSAPTSGGPPEKYVLEGRTDGNWGEQLDFDADNTRAAVPAAEIEGAETWRLRASNEHGMGKPSDEVGALGVEGGPGPGEGPTAEEPESDGAGTV